MKMLKLWQRPIIFIIIGLVSLSLIIALIDHLAGSYEAERDLGKVCNSSVNWRISESDCQYCFNIETVIAFAAQMANERSVPNESDIVNVIEILCAEDQGIDNRVGRQLLRLFILKNNLIGQSREEIVALLDNHQYSSDNCRIVNTLLLIFIPTILAIIFWWGVRGKPSPSEIDNFLLYASSSDNSNRVKSAYRGAVLSATIVGMALAVLLAYKNGRGVLEILVSCISTFQNNDNSEISNLSNITNCTEVWFSLSILTLTAGAFFLIRNVWYLFNAGSE